MKKFKKIIAMCLTAAMALSMMSVGAFAASDDIYALSEEETRERGFVIINEDIYDLNGKLIIDMEDGFTPDGYTLDETFEVHYPTPNASARTNISLMRSANALNNVAPAYSSNIIYQGTGNVQLNVDGNQGTQFGTNFKPTSTCPYVDLYYASGTPTGLNMAIHNVTRGTIVDWVSNVQKGDYSMYLTIYNSARPNDTYKALVSAEGVAGTATFVIENWGN